MQFGSVSEFQLLLASLYQDFLQQLALQDKLTYAQLQGQVIYITALSQGAMWLETGRTLAQQQFQHALFQLQPIFATVDKAYKIIAILQS